MLEVSFNSKVKLLCLFSICLLLSGCTGIQFPNLQTMLVNLGTSLPPLRGMIRGVAYLLGLAFCMKGIYALKVYGEGRTMMSSQASIKAPLIYLVVGSMLLWLPSTQSVFLQTFFGTGSPSPLSYNTTNIIWNEQATQVLMQVVQIVGLVSFIRGWVFLAHSAQPSGQPVFGKAMTHIVGGILAINIEGTREMLQATFGFG